MELGLGSWGGGGRGGGVIHGHGYAIGWAVPVLVDSFQPLHHNDLFTSNIYLECFGATL